jgi:myo-inositol-1(or 4)-monophosphatase
MLATGFPYEVSQERSSTNIDNFVRMQRHYQKIRRLGSAAIDLAYVAEGVFDGMWELWLKEWDTAAGMLLVTEAGGLCERIDGRPFVPGAPDVLVAATPELLASMRMILNS